MATGKSWLISVPITASGGIYGYIKAWFQEEYNALGNYSDLKVTKMTGSNSIRAGGFQSAGTITVNGAPWYSWNANNWVFSGLVGDCDFSTYSGATYPSGLRIYHDDDGSKTITVAVNVSYYYGYDTGWSGTGGTVSQSIALTSIPRASGISATDANIGAVSSIAVSRKSSVYTHSIKYQFGSLSGYINADGSISSSEVKLSETSIGFTIPTAFYAQIPNSKTGTCTLTIKTYSDSTQIGSAQSCSFTVTAAEAACAPAVSGTVVDTNDTTIALTGDRNKLVRFYSNALATITATAKNSATIASKSIAGVAVTDNTRTIEAVEGGSFEFAATDSRGHSNSVQVDKTLIEYIKLTANMEVARDDPTSGRATLVVKGDYYNGSFGAVNNSLELKCRIDDGREITVTPTLDGNTYAAIIALSGLDYRSYYNIEVVATDKLASVTKSQTLNKGIPNFHQGENDVTFEVDLIARKSLAVGDAETTRKNLGLGAAATEDVLPISKGGTDAADAATARANLGITPGNIGAIEMKLLWSNASLASNFPSQKISLDLSGYQRVRIDCYPVQTSVAGSHYGYSFVEGCVGCRLRCVAFSDYNYDGYGASWMSTRFADVSTSGVTFGTGGYTRTTNGEVGANNDYCIPARIYGIKGVK